MVTSLKTPPQIFHLFFNNPIVLALLIQNLSTMNSTRALFVYLLLRP